MKSNAPGQLFGQRLKKYRKAKGMSRLRLARAIDFMVGPQTIWRYETGQAHPPLHVALKLAEGLQISLEELINGQS